MRLNSRVDAADQLTRIAAALARCGLETVLIGNAAAALQGAPVTTLDIDFMFRKTAANLRKLKALADHIGGQILRPYYPMSGLYRVVVDDEGVQLDFMSVVHGIRSFAALRSRATAVEFAGSTLLVASIEDIIASKRALGRPKDRAVMPLLERVSREKRKQAN